MKRAVSTAWIVTIILGLLVIAGVGVGFTDTGRALLGQLFPGDTSPGDGSGFSPYQVELSADEGAAVNSLNALSCALNSVVTGGLGVSDASICNYHSGASFVSEPSLAGADGALPRIQGAAVGGTTPEDLIAPSVEAARLDFGETSVWCEGGQLDYATVKLKDADHLARLVSNCYTRWEGNNFDPTWCNQVEITEDTALVTEQTFYDALRHLPHGSTIRGDGVTTLQQYEWDSSSSAGIGDPLRKGAFFICGDDSYGNEIHLTQDIGECSLNNFFARDSPEDLLSTRCYVEDFSLPQTISEGEWEEYLAGYGDPQYVFYYEVFPDGEEDAWIVDFGERYLVEGAKWNAAFALAPAAFKLLGGLGRFGFAAGQLFVTSGASGLAKIASLGKLGQFQKMQQASAAIQKANSVYGGMRAFSSTASSAERARQVLMSGASLADDGAGLVIDDLAHFVHKTARADSILKNVKPGDLQKLGSGALEKTAREMLAAEGAETILKKNGDEARRLVEVLAPLDAAGTGAAMRTAAASGQFDEAGTLYARALASEGRDLSREFLLKKATEATGDNAVAEAFVNVVQARLAQDVAEEALTKAGVSAANDQFASQWVRSSAQYGRAHALGYASATLQWQADSMDNKFVPLGANALGMHRPYEIPITTDEADVLTPLRPELAPYFLALEREVGQDKSRLFFASPCEARLKVSKSLCECVAPSVLADQHDFGKGPQFVNNVDFEATTAAERYAMAVKHCHEPGVFSTSANAYGIVSTPVLRSSCVTVEVELADTGDDPNFCFQGPHLGAKVAKGGVITASIVGSIVAGASVCATTGLQTGGLACAAAVAGSQIVIGSAGAYAEYELNKNFAKWPVH